MITTLLFVVAILLGIIAGVLYTFCGVFDTLARGFGSAFGVLQKPATFLDYWPAHIFTTGSIGVFIWAIIRVFS